MSKLGKAFALASVAFVLSSTSAFAEAVKTYIDITKPPAGTVIMETLPSVSLFELTAAGTQDPKVEWSENAKKYLYEAAEQLLKNKSYKIQAADLDKYENPEALQILKLNDAVTGSIAAHNFFLMKLPTKTSFDWTLGQGVKAIIPQDLASGENAPKYGVFINAQGTYSSDGRKALMIGAALLGSAIPMGGQIVQSTIVDLSTGQVVWYNMSQVGLGTDIRTKEGALAHMEKMFKDMPL